MKQKIFNTIKSKVTTLVDSLYLFRNEDLPSFLLHDLFHSGTYLPFTTHSLKFRNLANICNDIVINSRRDLLELGSGISTIIIARLMKKNNIQGKLISIEEDKNWIQILNEILVKEGISDYVEFIHLPTIQSNEVLNSWEYDKMLLKEFIGDKKFDLILIDGPKAWPKNKEFSRLSNIKIVSDHLNEKAIVFIDNANRKSENELANKIEKMLGSKKISISSSFVAISSDQNFDFEI